uniref:Reverse transcriptase domain-containing protein n=1 Tax=Anabas testudineus TaxID=64144 RepID=A0AAQ6IAB7_ANATE
MNTDFNSVNSFLETLPSYSSCSFSSLLGNVKKEEVLESIKQLNTGKSPGPGGLPTEFYQVKALAYADDVCVIIKNQTETDILCSHLKLYEKTAGAKLNHNKTEGVGLEQRVTNQILTSR